MIIKSLCEFAAKHLPEFTIAPGGKEYLSRYYFLLKDRKLFNIYLHHFHQSDQDKGTHGYGLLHNHPFAWSFSIILVNGYAEERRLENGNIIVRKFTPGSINFITRRDFHRVDLLNGKVWTLFITGPRKKDLENWYFWDRVTNEYSLWSTHPDAIA